MKVPTRFPLLAKVLAWLVLHLVILALGFFLFVRWQLGMGLESLLSGSAGDRLLAFGDEVEAGIADLPPEEWNQEIERLARVKKVSAALFKIPRTVEPSWSIPANVTDRVRSIMPPPRPQPPPHHPRERQPPDREFDGPKGMPPPPGGPGAGPVNPATKPVFLMRGDHGDGYWAGVQLQISRIPGQPPRPAMLLVRSDRLDGSGMFFDYLPWLWGGLAVLLLSLAFWTPFVWGISRYLHRLNEATDRIASGKFDISLPPGGNDELGTLGRTIETMAARLDHLVSGQKRFLGDAAHELCAPLARIRTGLGILEMKAAAADAPAISSIEADVAELAALVDEILAFSRAGNRKPTLREISLKPLVLEVMARESPGLNPVVSIPQDLVVFADPALLSRAIGNLIRNSMIHAGPHPKMELRAADSSHGVSLSVTDDGPGVPKEELPRLFEPFYRLDRSRSRDTGGSGLGLAIVRSAIETCGGQVSASLSESGSLCVTLHFPHHSHVAA